MLLVRSDIWDLGEYCRLKQKEYESKGMHCRRNCVPDSFVPDAKRAKLSHDESVQKRNIAFFRAHYDTTNMPKVVLNTHATKGGFDHPVYTTQKEDRLFQSVVEYQNKKYSSSYWEKNKRFAEQGAALVCILELGLVNKEDLIKNGSLTE